MKTKILYLLMILVFINTIATTGYAESFMAETPETAPQELPSTTEETILDLLAVRAQEQNLQKTFLNPETVTDDLKGYSLEGKPVLLFIRNIARYYDPEDPVGMLTEVWENGRFELISLYVVETSIDDEGTIRLAYNPPNPVFPLGNPENAGITRRAGAVDIRPFHEVTLTGSVKQEFLGALHEINNVIFIGDYSMWDPPCAVYFTDGGVFVRVCWGDPESYPEYTWHDFAELYNAYSAYLSGNSRDEDGNLLVGNNGDFLNYIENIYPAKGNGNTQHIPEEPSYTWAYILGTCLLACGIVTVVVIRKQKHLLRRKRGR